MEPVKESQFTRRYNKIMFITSFVVICISIALIVLQISHQVEHENNQLIEDVRSRSVAVDNLIVSITEHLNLMQTKAETFFLDCDSADHSKAFNSLSNKNNTFYDLDEIPSPYSESQVGNLTGEGNPNDFSASLITELEMALSLNSLFEAAKQNIPNSAWIYYTSKNNFINIYPWVPSGKFQFSQELYTHEFYTWGLPSVNPDRKIFWTPAYLDEYGEGLMVTAAKPVYREDEFIGTVAIDVTLDRLTEYVQGFKETAGTVMIVNEQNQLIAHPELALSENDIIYTLEDALPESLQVNPSRLFEKEPLQLVELNAHQSTWYRLKNAPWKVLFISKEQNIVFRILSMVGTVFFILLVALSVMLFTSKQITSQEFIRPAENLVRHIAKESENEPSPVPKVPHAWLPWFREISRIFTENRNLIQEIKEKNEILTEMNISLERYMPKFILLINIKKGSGGTTIGNFFADTLAKIDPAKKTVYMEYPAPEKILADFDIDSTQQIYKHPNGYDIWSSYKLGVIPDDAKSSLLVTKILDNYDNIVVNVSLRKGNNIEKELEIEILPMLKYAKAVVFLIPPDEQHCDATVQMVNVIKKYVRQTKTNFYILVNRKEDKEKDKVYSNFDLEIPFIPTDAENFKVGKDKFAVPGQVKPVLTRIVDQVERVHHISVFIPTTMDVDKKFDTSAYVQKTLDFFGEKFGGATSTKADGAWKSDSEGMVNEVVYVVISYVTESDLNNYIDNVIDFVKTVKTELHQEAMSIEINNKMILV